MTSCHFGTILIVDFNADYSVRLKTVIAIADCIYKTLTYKFKINFYFFFLNETYLQITEKANLQFSSS